MSAQAQRPQLPAPRHFPWSPSVSPVSQVGLGFTARVLAAKQEKGLGGPPSSGQTPVVCWLLAE